MYCACVVRAKPLLPMVLQNKLDPYHVGKQLDNEGDKVMKLARLKKMEVVAYSSFSAYPFAMTPIEDPIIKYIAKRHGEKHNRATTTGLFLLFSFLWRTY